MTSINKAHVYRTLYEIQNKYKVNISKYVAMLVGSEEISYEVIVFINKYQPIDKLITYNEIYNKRRNSPLFRNIVRTNNTLEEKAIILSSLLTQSLISIKHCKDLECKEEIIDTINVDVITNALKEYVYNNNADLIEDTFDTFQLIFKTLFPKK